jgi:two-component system phosphate regulon sensor histidine kinase PhoR
VPAPLRLGIRGKLFLASLGLLSVSVLAAQLFLGAALDRLLLSHLRADLLVRARLIAISVEARAGDGRDWDLIADELGGSAGARVTIIGAGGVVLGDSQLSGSALQQAGDHGGRPEVLRALSEGQGDSIRRSDTLGLRMLYAAVPFHARRGAGHPGVVRLALPLSTVDGAQRGLRLSLWGGLLLLLGVAAVLDSVAGHFLLRRLRLLTACAYKMANGDLAVRTRATGHDEISALGQALDQLASGLSATVRELQGERDLLSGILRDMHEGVLLIEQDDRVVLINDALRAMLLLSADAVGARAPGEVLSAELRALIAQARAGKHASGEVDLAGLKPRRALVHAAPLSGDPDRVLVVFVDVTELRRLESLRRDFVANVSHELRTPVTAIRSAAETLVGAAAEDREATGHFVAIIERNAERLARLVEDLLDLSRIESRSFQLSPEQVPLADLVGGTLLLFHDRAAKKRLELRAEVPLGLEVVADPRALEQVLTNLVDNAIKYCPEGARIVVRAGARSRPDERGWWLEVKDSGPGIDQRHLPRLFERFYRVDAGRSRQLGGTGLGLSIVKHLVEAMGGKVSVQSRLGEGSTFRCDLPG